MHLQEPLRGLTEALLLGSETLLGGSGGPLGATQMTQRKSSISQQTGLLASWSTRSRTLPPPVSCHKTCWLIFMDTHVCADTAGSGRAELRPSQNPTPSDLSTLATILAFF